MSILSNPLEEVNRFGVSLIVSLQNAFPGWDDLFHVITELGNSTHSFTLLIPLAAALDLQLACDLLVVCIVGEWSNTLLKWFLMEGRPYWWVRETEIYEKYGLTLPVLQQTSHTCETGAGSPSGHVMHAAVVGFVLAKWLIAKYESRSKFPRPNAPLYRKLVWSLFAMMLIIVALSRMYIAAHFPHQCLLGAALGIPLAWALTSESSSVCRWWKNASRGKLLAAALLLSLLAFGGYWLQKALGIDPQWSVKLAFKWCKSERNLHVSTTNVFSLVRDCGSAFGFAIACPFSKRLMNKRLSIPFGILLALLLNVAVRSVQKSIPTANVFTFFSAHFFLHASLPLLVLLYFPKPSGDPERTSSESNTRRTSTRQSRAKYD
ncbi:hypothetical protein FOCC_FOCC014833 [Frankliniella occidentalis]|uniref:glucose-6-phosphatase n=1 Tax=Frankliniella occidentalis TaxID=133901 RepID=A0A6J1T0V7_FRAOC|nr:glucose-6-phosphatase 2 [Frankliniella occidentalis]KAE8739675.1 hypothetical protein FOCC_FOCC014833 [Frankliniella occidentalis]